MLSYAIISVDNNLAVSLKIIILHQGFPRCYIETLAFKWHLVDHMKNFGSTGIEFSNLYI